MFQLLSTASMPFALKISPLITVGAIVVLLGLIGDAVIIARFLPSPQYRVSPKPWGLRAVLVSVLVLAGIILVANGCYALVAVLQHSRTVAKLAFIVLPSELLLRIGVLIGFAAYFRLNRISIRNALGLNAMPLGSAAGWGVLFCLASLPPIGVIIFVTEIGRAHV